MNLHGHCHPHITSAIAAQAKSYDQIIFTHFTHTCAIELTERLLKLLPPEFSKGFFTDGGSTAVEAALKMAIHYWKNRGIEKNVICAFEGGYHGDTFGAMSLGGHSPYSVPFWPYQFEVHTIPPPFKGDEEKSLAALKKLKNPACFIFEPLIQGAGGMRIYSKEGLEQLLAYCENQEIITIADEVMTGFGRTGPLFVTSTLKTPPDLITLSKGITGGTLPLGLTLCKEKIHTPFVSTNPSHTFVHGHSYTANPIACAAALASLDLTLSCTPSREQINKAHQKFCTKWQHYFKRAETLGTILALEFEHAPNYHQLIAYFLQHNIYLRPLGNVLYVMPPYCITPSELQYIYQTIEQGIIDEFQLSNRKQKPSQKMAQHPLLS